MLDMGFKEDLDTIVESLPAERRSHLMSATFPQQVKRLADRFQTNALHVQGTALGEANADIQHVVHVVRHDERYAAIVNTLLVSLGQRALIFVERRSDAAQVAEMLSADGFSAAHLSGELAQAQRTRTLEAFRRGHIDVLVATDVAARGLDVTDIAIVIHADLPADAESYTHRSGRTGRAGQHGRSVLFTSPPNAHRVEGMLRAARVDASWAPAPTAKQIHKAQRKRHRAALHALLSSDERPTDSELEYASNLLEDRDPAHVVAALLRLSDPGLPCEPRQLTPMLKPHPAPPPGRHHPQHGRARPQRRPPRGPRGRKPPHARRTRS
jgi:ATP-dependent RNA helicase DeaD